MNPGIAASGTLAKGADTTKIAVGTTTNNIAKRRCTREGGRSERNIPVGCITLSSLALLAPLSALSGIVLQATVGTIRPDDLVRYRRRIRLGGLIGMLAVSNRPMRVFNDSAKARQWIAKKAD